MVTHEEGVFWTTAVDSGTVGSESHCWTTAGGNAVGMIVEV